MGQLAAEVNFEFHAGSTWRDSVVYEVETEVKDVFVPFDLTGWSARMQLRSALDSTIVDLEITSSNGLLILGGDTGLISVLVYPLQTTPLGDVSGPVEYVHGIELFKDIGGGEEDVIPLFYGKSTANRDLVHS